MFKKLFGNKYTKWILLLTFLLGVGITDYCLHNYFNTEGYRGKLLDDKKNKELRIACFGGSMTFGFGVSESESWPAQLQNILPNNYSVANLGANNQGIYGISHDVNYYNYLHYDIAILYQGETDREPNKLLENNFRGNDPIFYLFGYKQALGFYIKEGIRQIMPTPKGDSITVFKKEANTDTTRAQVNKHYIQANTLAKEMIAEGKTPYEEYIAKLDETLHYLITHKIRTIVVCQPNSYESIQHYCIRKLLEEKYSNKVEYLNLSNLFINLDSMTFDGMHLRADGYKIVAEKMKESILHFQKP